MLELPTPLCLQVSGPLGAQRETADQKTSSYGPGPFLSLSFPQTLNSEHTLFTKILQQIKNKNNFLQGWFASSAPCPQHPQHVPRVGDPSSGSLFPPSGHIQIESLPKTEAPGVTGTLLKPEFSRIFWGIGNSWCYSLSSSLKGSPRLSSPPLVGDIMDKMGGSWKGLGTQECPPTGPIKPRLLLVSLSGYLGVEDP